MIPPLFMILSHKCIDFVSDLEVEVGTPGKSDWIQGSQMEAGVER